MRYAIHIEDMTADELTAVTNFIQSMGAAPAARDKHKVSQTVAELAAATGAAPSSPPPAPPVNYPGTIPGAPVGADPFAAPAAPPAAPAGDVDSRGIPHNPQFHADSRRQNKDGSWARRKGVNKEACDAWEASATRTPAAPPAGIPAPLAPPTTAPVAHPNPAEVTAKFAPHLAGQPNGATVPAPAGTDPFAAPAAPPAPPAPPAPAAPVVEDLPEVSYAEWHQLYSNLIAGGKMTAEKYTEIAERYGAVENPMVFNDQPDARNRSYRDMMALAA